jgi:hypothetical protein
MSKAVEPVGPAMEHRNSGRRPASSVPEITGVRLKPHGADATLVNISTSGILVECASRIKPGTAVIIVFEGTFRPAQIEARVARSSVAIMHKGGGLGYHTGIAFNQPIVLPELPQEINVPDEPERQAEVPAPVMAAAVMAEPTPVVLVNRW